MSDKEEQQQLESLAEDIQALNHEDAFHMGSEFAILNEDAAISAQNERVQEILQRIEDGVQECLVAPGGTADEEKLHLLSRMGIDVQLAGDPEDPSVAAIQIKLADGTLQYDVNAD